MSEQRNRNLSAIHIVLLTLLLISFGLLVLPLPFTVFNALVGVNIVEQSPLGPSG